MATKAQKVRLSVFLIVSAAVFLAFFFVLVGGKIFKRMDTYYIVYRDVTITGLEAGAQVKFNGVPVGRVTGLSVETAEAVRVTIEVNPGTPIKTDTKAVLNFIGVTGLKYVELTGGSDRASRLPPGGTILAGQSIIDILSGSASTIAERLNIAINNISQMTGPENVQALNHALTSFAGVAAQLDTLFKFTRPDLMYAIATLDSTMTEFHATSRKADNRVTAMDNIMRSGDLQATLSNTRHISDTMRTQMDSLNIPQLTGDLHTLVQNANSTVTH
ncbi:MAG TPA: MlaD family protein, partial [Armatimonadota bacterium]|nr:MlaD family protein [Armatimonadota bacterium]